MNTMQTRILVTGLFFLFIFLSGFLLSGAGKPHNRVYFNLHKLVGLAAGIFLVITVLRIRQENGLETIQIASIVLTALIFFVLVAAGGLTGAAADGTLQSASQALLSTASSIHKVFPYLALLSTGATYYLLMFSRS